MSVTTDETSLHQVDIPLRPALRHKIKVTPSLSDYPRSHVANYVCPTPITSEQEALNSIKDEWKKFSDDELVPHTLRPRRQVVVADLQDFEIYRCPSTDHLRPFELASLHLFDVKAKNLCFDGFVELGNVRHYVQRVSIIDISIEGYGRTNSPRAVAYVQTRLASKDTTHDVWLRLRRPAPPYGRFHTPFVWVSTFATLVLNFMDDQRRASVGLASFQADFHAWLMRRVGQNGKFKKWFAAFRNESDFRVALHAYVDYIYNQAVNLSTARHLLSHPVWADCKCARMMAVERQPNLVKDTLATPHVFESFKHMYFASKLKQIRPSKAVRRMQEKRKQKLGFAEDNAPQTSSVKASSNNARPARFHTGDVVSIVPDNVDKARWKRSGDEWLAYVQGVEPSSDGTQRLLVIWLYRPADTNMFHAKYRMKNELFLSDNCNCREARISSKDVIKKHSVGWSPRSLNTTEEFIVRQTYITQDSSFVTVKDEHKTCSCRKPTENTFNWHAGDTVYFKKTINGQKLLEPAVIYKVNHKSKEVEVRTLLRLGRDCPALAREAKRTRVAPNELVLTDKLQTLSQSRIERACHIRFFQQSDVLTNRIPSPYNLRGAGDFWFISMALRSTDDGQRLAFLKSFPKGIHEARETPLPGRKLRGMSLFSGGGGLDRGLEQGGAVEFQTSIDYDAAAIHTQRANCHDPRKMRLFCGSVDDYLQLLLSGTRSEFVARVGEVDFIAAGSPCPGFSALQQDMLSQQSLTYASHVTTFCTAVDIYRPLYGVLENVVNMASTRKGLEEQNVLSQLVACLVSMGYQVNQYIMDSWTYGSFQGRSRIILTIAAPGLEPILQRAHTHSRSYEETKARSLGRLPNGERFGDREHYATPFSIVSAEEGTSDLPDIGNGNVQTCIPFPDHRLSRPTNSKNRALLECIPRQPPGCGYTKAMQLDLVPPLLQLKKKDTSGACRRIKAEGLVATITTDVSIQDARNGASIHWSQHRPLCIQEARRAQGYPDDELIIGTLKEQWKIIGNGVDRKVSFSIGLALRDALIKSKRIPKLSDTLKDETELIVDDEDVKEHMLEASECLEVDVLREVSPSLSVSSTSTDSFSSARGMRETLHSSTLVGPLISTYTASLQRSVEVEERLIVTEGSFSRLSHKVTTEVARLSLSAVPAFIPPAHPSLPTKRERKSEEGGRQDNCKLTDTNSSLFKRLKLEEMRRTTTPEATRPKSEVGSTARPASLPPFARSRHTRRSGPAEFTPKEWHKKIESPSNVVQLS